MPSFIKLTGQMKMRYWLSFTKTLIFFLIGLTYYHINTFLTKDKKDVFEPWWVWELTLDGSRKVIDPVSWDVADNSNVIKAIVETSLTDGGKSDMKIEEDVERSDHNVGRHPLIKLEEVKKEKQQQHLKKKPSETKHIALFHNDMRSPVNIDSTACGGSCIVTNNPTRANQPSRFEAVVVDNNYLEKNELPHRNSYKELFVWMNQESPYKMSQKKVNRAFLIADSKAFNMTMTYRRDSDVYYPSFSRERLLHKIRADGLPTDPAYLVGKKNKLLYWMPTECGFQTVSQMAFDIVYRLKASGLKIDYFGQCWREASQKGTERFNLDMLARYKFVLVFGKDWHCRDCISDEIWHEALLVGTVPIIWGPNKNDLDKLLPKNSFMFLEDFVSAFELNNYLEYLDKNDEALQEYLRWREEPVQDPISSPQKLEGFCQLCFKLHTRSPDEKQIVKSIKKWWYDEELEQCLRPGTNILTTTEKLSLWRTLIMLKVDNFIPWMDSTPVTLYYLKLLTAISFVLFFGKAILKLSLKLVLSSRRHKLLTKELGRFYRFLIRLLRSSIYYLFQIKTKARLNKPSSRKFTRPNFEKNV